MQSRATVGVSGTSTPAPVACFVSPENSRPVKQPSHTPDSAISMKVCSSGKPAVMQDGCAGRKHTYDISSSPSVPGIR